MIMVNKDDQRAIFFSLKCNCECRSIGTKWS